MTTKEIQQQIIKELNVYGDWMDKYGYLIKLGKALPPIDAIYKTKDTLIKGCQVRTWFHSTLEGGKVFYQIESKSFIVRGIVVLLLRVLSGQKPEDIVNIDLFFIDETGLRENFSPIRANSLWKLVNRMKTDAAMYLAGETSGQIR